MAASADRLFPASALLTTPGFFRVNQLVPIDQDVVSVPVGTRVCDALETMRARDFDQLPVLTARGGVIGTFTYRSLARGLTHLRAQDDPLVAPVDDLVEDLQFVRSADEISAVLGSLEADRAVLVGDEENLIAVVTTDDLNASSGRRRGRSSCCRTSSSRFGT
ncbi:CBS domain-containing protein [Amycolatopsis carbonis]|uniref:CBS domain-containing protein n=1 Tax=Amycolatopsis carbonis TaxID=715471 RepID=A0A9Y2N1B4_9PSEU|nr:CBS domain-containing protein [Amycolatopsis sp. 2-15]WIX82884.1 CBS domain-containing protein [Amycolatopsis sp. 2-15]